MQKPVKYFGITNPFKVGNHYGVDLGWSKSSGHNQPIYAIEDGIVIYKATQKTGGKVIHIKHSNGYVSEYAHLNSWLVSINDKVRKGQQIGTMGATGKVSGEHLHLGLYKGTSIDYSKMSGFVNPVPYLVEDYKEPAKDTSSANSPKTYVVVKGDTLSSIASKFNTTYQKLAEYNKILNPNVIKVGQVIKIPSASTIKHKVAKGDTISGLCIKYYGKYTKELGNKIVESNKKNYPKICLNWICVGWILTIPEL